MNPHLYLLALGSNQRHPQFGRPRDVLEVALDLMAPDVGEVLARSPVITSAPVGPSQRQYANGAAVVASKWAPCDMLVALQAVEQAMGRKRMGQRWRSRTLDLDIILWSGGIVAEQDLQIPHPRFRERTFVLGPAAAIAPDWRDPVTGLTVKQLHARLTRKRPVPR